MKTFGTIIAEARRLKGLSQKELAAKVRKEDGQAISAQYLNDIEHDRRNPPNDVSCRGHWPLRRKTFRDR